MGPSARGTLTSPDSEILKRTEALIGKIHQLGERAQNGEQKQRAKYAEKCLKLLAESVRENRTIFHVEPWHALYEDLPLQNAGEMLLRVKDAEGTVMPPYPAIMTLYSNGFTEELDTILCLCALRQFENGPDKQVSINVSSRSLQNADFVKAVLTRLDELNLDEKTQKIILEIHESNAVVRINEKTLDLFRNFGVGFAIDDVGLSMNDVFRLSAFENIADYIKLDRASLSAHTEDPRSLKPILTLALSLLPRAHMVAEGVQSAQHAADILNQHPGIHYVQGLYLPGREEFARDWAKVRPKK